MVQIAGSCLGLNGPELRFRVQPQHNVFEVEQKTIRSVMDTIGALIIRIGFWNPLYYKYKKEPPQ